MTFVSQTTARAGRWRPMLLAAVLIAVVLVADRITKHIVRGHIGFQQSDNVISGVLRLVHYRNTGVAFDALSGTGLIVVIIEVLAVLALLTYFVTHPSRRGLWLPTGLLVGGAAGNLLDRIINGYVTDFIKFPHWPAFNVADIAITVGVIVLIWVLEFGARRDGPTRR